MDILQFLSSYWEILLGIVLVIIAWANLQSDSSDHGKRIAVMEGKYEGLSDKFEDHKDKITESINLIQQDIREIMTILKRNP